MTQGPYCTALTMEASHGNLLGKVEEQKPLEWMRAAAGEAPTKMSCEGCCLGRYQGRSAEAFSMIVILLEAVRYSRV